MFGNNRDGSNDQTLARSGEALKVGSKQSMLLVGSQVTRGFPRTLESHHDRNTKKSVPRSGRKERRSGDLKMQGLVVATLETPASVQA